MNALNRNFFIVFQKYFFIPYIRAIQFYPARQSTHPCEHSVFSISVNAPHR